MTISSGTVIDAIYMPAEVERGMKGGPAFMTTILKSANGVQTPVMNWATALHKWQLGVVGIRGTVLDDFKTFFLGRRGMAYGFLFKDWGDFRSATLETIGTGNGVKTVFPLIKTYADSLRPYVRVITRPRLSGTGLLTVYKNAVPQTTPGNYSFADGNLTFTVAPPVGHVITANFYFDVPVVFTMDQWELELFYEGMGSLPQFSIEEVNEYAQI